MKWLFSSYTVVYNAADWPAQDVVVDPSTCFPYVSQTRFGLIFHLIALSKVQGWMQELNGHDIPDIPLTSGTCAGSPNSTAYALQNGWWTCGAHTRPTDIVACPDPLTWGTSFDDGPSPYSQ
jgi:hypothetical protein